MKRIIFTKISSEVFKGPFVYDLSDEQMEKKLRKMSWLEKRKEIVNKEGKDTTRIVKVGTLSFEELEKYPKEAVFPTESEDLTLSRVKLAQYSWKE